MPITQIYHSREWTKRGRGEYRERKRRKRETEEEKVCKRERKGAG